METLEQQIFPDWLEQLQSCPQGYPASRVPLPGSDEARRMTAGSGKQCSMLFDQLTPLGAFSRILLESSHWTSSEQYCYVWERLDTRFALSAFQLTPLGQSTEDNGSSLWRTPKERDYKGAMNGQVLLEWGSTLNLSDQAKTPALWPTPMAEYSGRTEDKWQTFEQEKRGGAMDLQRAVKLWPTPTSGNHHENQSLEEWEASNAKLRQRRKDLGNRPDMSGHGYGLTLGLAAKLWPTPRKEGYDAQGKDHGDLVYEVKNRLWPTPTERDWKSTSHGNQDNARPLSEVAGLTGSGSLNPRFVEELMGFPIDHTALKL
jgi:hypothetical protein